MRVCAHLQSVWQHPWLSPMRHEQHPPNSWDNQTDVPRGTGSSPAQNPCPTPFSLSPPLVAAISLTVLAFLDRQEGRAGGRDTDREETRRVPGSFLGGCFYAPKAFLSSSLGQRPTRNQQNGSSGGAVRFINKDDHFFVLVCLV